MHRSSALLLPLVLLLASPAAAQSPYGSRHFQPADPVDNPSTKEKVALGRFLFESTLLSQNRKISCATCHDPAQGFADSLPESRGIFETQVGRNSPTLWGIAMSPGFMGDIPPQSSNRRAKRKQARLLSLEERCLTPIENPIEMGSSIRGAVRTLKAVPGLRQRFDEAFGKQGIGINGDRIGRALAAFLRIQGVPESPFRDFVGGELEALEGPELRGLSIFRGRGKCAECHSGPYLSDGRLHVVMENGGFRQRQQFAKQIERLTELAKAHAADASKRRSRRSRSPLAPGQDPDIRKILTGRPSNRPSGYGGNEQFTSVHTPTLWDVARTGPYFRDGSVETLEVAVRQHVEELQKAGRRIMPGCGPIIVPNQLADVIPEQLRPKYAGPAYIPRPARLNADEMADVVAFLGSLSPR